MLIHILVSVIAFIALLSSPFALRYSFSKFLDAEGWQTLFWSFGMVFSLYNFITLAAIVGRAAFLHS